MVGTPPSAALGSSRLPDDVALVVDVVPAVVLSGGGVTFPPMVGVPPSCRGLAGESGVSVAPGEQAAKRTGTANSASVRENRLISTFLSCGATDAP